jgi:prevent-host-death family protein
VHPHVRFAELVIPSDWYYHLTMKEIGAAKFKEQCLAILDEVDEEGIVITKRGKPVAKLIPIRAESADLIGALKGKVRIKGDILSTGVRWHAEP